MDQISIPQEPYDFKSAKKQFSRIGFALLAFLVATELSALLLQLGLLFFFSVESIPAWARVVLSCVCMYGIGVPVVFLCLRGTKIAAPKREEVGITTLCVLFLIAYALSYVGNLLGIFSTVLFEKLTGLYITAPAIDLISEIPWYLTLLYAVILGPLFEELIFRKWILDRTRAYGEKTAIVFSALLFGLFHMNLQQFFYAFFIGLVLSYLYLRTGKLTVCWLLHGAYNFFGGFLQTVLMQQVDLDALLTTQTPEEMLAVVEADLLGYVWILVYSGIVLCMEISGAVLLVVYRKRWPIAQTECALPRDSEASTAFANVGVGLFVVISIVFPILVTALERLA